MTHKEEIRQKRIQVADSSMFFFFFCLFTFIYKSTDDDISYPSPMNICFVFGFSFKTCSLIKIFDNICSIISFNEFDHFHISDWLLIIKADLVTSAEDDWTINHERFSVTRTWSGSYLKPEKFWSNENVIAF